MDLIVSHGAEDAHSGGGVERLDGFTYAEGFVFADAHEVILEEDGVVCKFLCKLNNKLDNCGIFKKIFERNSATSDNS